MDRISFIKIKFSMKKTILISVIAGLAGIAIGYKVPKDKNVGYVMISGRITNPEQAGKFRLSYPESIIPEEIPF